MVCKIQIATGLVSAAMLVVACGGNRQREATTSAAADPAPINELRSRYQTAYNAGDAAGVAALFSDDAVSLPDHHPAIEGREAIQKYLENEVFAQYAATIAITPVNTDISGDVAHEHGTYNIKVAPKAGEATVTDDGKYLVIFKRGADGAWKIHHDMDNSNRMPPPPPASTPPKPRAPKR